MEIEPEDQLVEELVDVPKMVLNSPYVRVMDRQCEIKDPETKELLEFAEPWSRCIDEYGELEWFAPGHSYYSMCNYWRATTCELNRAKLYIAKYDIQRLEESVRAMDRNPDLVVETARWLAGTCGM